MSNVSRVPFFCLSLLGAFAGCSGALEPRRERALGDSASERGPATDSGPALDASSTRDGAPLSAEGRLPDARPEQAQADFSAGDLDPGLGSLERRLLALPADSWYELPDSQLRPLCAPDSFGVRGVVGCAALVTAWGGGTWDASHRKFLLWGGGHNDYWGNEVYGFDLRQGQWERLTDPSPGPFDRDPLDDGNPASRHTYGGLAYISHADRFFGHGGSRAKDGAGTNLTWVFDVATRLWHNQAPTLAGPGGYSLTSSYDPATKLVFTRTPKNLQVYDYDQNSWTLLQGFGFKPLWPRYEVSGDKSSTVDTRRGLFWSVGSGDVLVWDIGGKALVTESWRTSGGGAYSNGGRLLPSYPEQLFESGGGDIFDAAAPGFDYDSKMDQIVAWKGGAAYVLDLDSKTWQIKSASGAPAKQALTGTYGRFAYLPHCNVFMLVNSVDSNVFFYKNSPGR